MEGGQSAGASGTNAGVQQQQQQQERLSRPGTEAEIRAIQRYIEGVQQGRVDAQAAREIGGVTEGDIEKAVAVMVARRKAEERAFADERAVLSRIQRHSERTAAADDIKGTAAVTGTAAEFEP